VLSRFTPELRSIRLTLKEEANLHAVKLILLQNNHLLLELPRPEFYTGEQSLPCYYRVRDRSWF